jgi:hypothetical protein
MMMMMMMTMTIDDDVLSVLFVFVFFCLFLVVMIHLLMELWEGVVGKTSPSLVANLVRGSLVFEKIVWSKKVVWYLKR